MHLVVLSKSTDFTKLHFRACFSHLFFSTLPRKGLNKSPIQQFRAIGSEILNFLQFNFMVVCLILIIISRLPFSFVKERININAYYTRSHHKLMEIAYLNIESFLLQFLGLNLLKVNTNFNSIMPIL